jgi:hypothetical protein
MPITPLMMQAIRNGAAATATPTPPPAASFDYPAFINGRNGAAFDISILTNLFSDRVGAGSSAAAVDGKVGIIRDAGGLGFNLVAISDPLRGTLRTAGGKYWLEGPFCYTNGSIVLGNPFPTTTPWTRVTAMMQLSSPGWTSGNRFWGGGADGAAGFCYQTGVSPQIGMYDSGGGNALQNGDLAMDTAGRFKEYHAGNVNSYDRVNLGTINTTNVGNLGAIKATGITLGANTNGTNPAAWRFYGAVMVDGALSAGEDTTIDNQLASLI